MLIIVSPAKRLDFDSPAPVSAFTQPSHGKQSQVLIDRLKKCSAKDLSQLMKLSDSLTELNMQRYKTFKRPFNIKNAKQALFAFQGDVYLGLDAASLKKSEVNYAQKHLRILSGLYGVIAPLDLIQPYRLEMGTKLKCGGSKNLYEFWGDDLTVDLNKILKKEKFLVNLASNEYSSAINFKKLTGEVITPVFKEKKGKQLKIVAIFAKKARGLMSRFIIQNKVTTVPGLKKFDAEGYKFSAQLSKGNELIFTRPQP
jgi:cytoplasmic iron level regulating protein YaaA (DUF328/UPF0246 family)